MAVEQSKDQAKDQAAQNLQRLGFKSPMDVIDFLAMLKVDGVPIITDDNVRLNPQLKAAEVIKYFGEKYGVKPNNLPYVASIIKRDLKNGKLRMGT